MKLSDFGTSALIADEGKATANQFAYKQTINTILRMIEEGTVRVEHINYRTFVKALPHCKDRYMVAAIAQADFEQLIQHAQGTTQ